MHARVATFEGGETDKVKQMIAEISQQAEDGPPEGLPAVGLLLLHSPEQGRVLSISLFETEEDLRQGDSTLSSMDPPIPGALGRRASVDLYEVGIKLDAPGE
jgi:hypothetical protein